MKNILRSSKVGPASESNNGQSTAGNGSNTQQAFAIPHSLHVNSSTDTDDSVFHENLDLSQPMETINALFSPPTSSEDVSSNTAVPTSTGKNAAANTSPAGASGPSEVQVNSTAKMPHEKPLLLPGHVPPFDSVDTETQTGLKEVCFSSL